MWQKDCQKSKMRILLDEDEFVEIIEATVEEAEEMMKSGQIFDANSI